MDGAMFDHKCTVIPNWVRDDVFNIKERFPHANKDHAESAVSIVIVHKGGKRTTHSGYVTTSERGKLPDVMRLYFGDDVVAWLSKVFNKTHLRNEQRKTRGMNGPTIERLMPFWELIDIEWDAYNSSFHFRAWYNLSEPASTKNNPKRDANSDPDVDQSGLPDFVRDSL
tara:strand:+ start:1793 stop:2299 length:507 start_codon:yes stop_codon:yes gene_type:complete